MILATDNLASERSFVLAFFGGSTTIFQDKFCMSLFAISLLLWQPHSLRAVLLLCTVVLCPDSGTALSALDL